MIRMPRCRKPFSLFFQLVPLLLFTTLAIYGTAHPALPHPLSVVTQDCQQFYSTARLSRMGIVFGIGGAFANTWADGAVQGVYQRSFRNASLDRLARWMKPFGEGAYLIPLSLAGTAFGHVLTSENGLTAVGTWGSRTARAFLVGAPALLLAQRLTGASRPGERRRGSRWRPLQDDNGVSGHAFIGATPFLTLARLNGPFLRYPFYVVSTLTAFSRLNDNAHYLSQCFLGWYLAWEATATVNPGEPVQTPRPFRMTPMVFPDGAGLRIKVEW